MQYEKSPGLWHAILWVAQHWFHAPYGAMNWIAAVLAAGGAALLVFCAPFPRPVCYLMSFSYYVAYQYAVIARPYVMLLLFGGLASIFYRRRSPIRFAIAIALLCATSVHGAILAAAISLGAAWHLVVKRDWSATEPRARYFKAAAIVALAGIMAAVIVRGPKDAGGDVRFATVQLDRLSALLNDTTVEPWPIGVCFLLGMAAFATWSGEAIVFFSAVGGLLGFEWLIFSLTQHKGAIVIAFIVSLWIAWPKDGLPDPKVKIAALGLAALFGIQTVWAVSAMHHDYEAPFSGSQDAALFLRSAVAEHGRIFGFCYPSVAIQAYFDHSIFQNWPTAYLTDAKSYDAACLLDGRTSYDYLVIPILRGEQNPYDQEILHHGYIQVHVSPGYVFFKQGIWITETFFIYRRSF